MLARKRIFSQYSSIHDGSRSSLIRKKKRQWRQQFIRNSQRNDNILLGQKHIYRSYTGCGERDALFDLLFQFPISVCECVGKQHSQMLLGIQVAWKLEDTWLFQTPFSRWIAIHQYRVFLSWGKIILPYPLEASNSHVTCFGQWYMNRKDVCHF